MSLWIRLLLLSTDLCFLCLQNTVQLNLQCRRKKYGVKQKIQNLSKLKWYIFIWLFKVISILPAQEWRLTVITFMQLSGLNFNTILSFKSEKLLMKQCVGLGHFKQILHFYFSQSLQVRYINTPPAYLSKWPTSILLCFDGKDLQILCQF